MPPKGKSRTRKRDSNFVVLKVSAVVTVGALGNGAVIADTLLDLDDDVSLISADLTWAMLDHTPGEGPIDVGISSDALTVGQVQEAITASPTSRGDRIALERSGRPVRSAGTFAGQLAYENLKDGVTIRTKLRFPLAQAQILDAYARNVGGATLTTGTLIRTQGRIYARWT